MELNETNIANQISGSTEWEKAKISKYVSELVKKLEKIFAFKNSEILKDNKVLNEMFKALKYEAVGSSSLEAVTEIMKKIVHINAMVGGEKISTRPFQIYPHKQTSMHGEEILRLLDIKLGEIVSFLQSEMGMIQELNAIYSAAKKRGWKSIYQHVKKANKKFKIEIKKQERKISENFLKETRQGRPEEEDYKNRAGRIYKPKIANGKCIIIYAGTTLNFRQYEPLSFRLALEGYLVLALNLPSHGSDLNFRIGNAAEILGQAIRDMKTRCRRVGAICFSFGALGALYNLFGFDYEFEVRLKKVMGDFVDALKKNKLNTSAEEYKKIKRLVYESIMRSYNPTQRLRLSNMSYPRVNLVAGQHSGKPDAVIFGGMPLSMYKSKKLVCPSAISITYGWMKFVTNTFFNNPPIGMRKLINGLERHNPIEEPEFENKENIYLKFFEIKGREEFNELKEYIDDLTRDPENVIALIIAFGIKSEEGKARLVEYVIRKLKMVPKFFIYGEKDSIVSGSYVKELLMKPFGKKSLDYDIVSAFINQISQGSPIKLYSKLGHTFDEKAGFIKKLSRRPQNIDVQNDMVEFMNRYL